MDEATTGFIVCLVIGLIIVVMGVYMAVTGNPRLLHSYHYATVPPQKLPALARATGVGLIVSGVGCTMLVPPAAVAAVVGTRVSDLLSIAGIVLLLLGIAGTLLAVVRYNGSLFTFGPVGVAPAPSRGAVIGFTVLVAVIVLGATIVPGVLMASSGDPSALHGYHLVNVAPDDLPKLALGEGIAMVALGVSLVVAVVGGALGALHRPTPLWTKVMAVVGFVGFMLSIVAMLLVIIHYNGSLMG